MSLRRSLVAVVVMTIAFLHAGPADAIEAPWRRLKLFKKVEADPNKPYRLAADNGPWMIMAASFSGDNAERQAHELALELRREHKLPAFVHQMKFDFTGEVRGRGLDKWGKPRSMRYLKYSGNRGDGPNIHEIAVLVGNYESVEHPKAQRDLNVVKTVRPVALTGKNVRETNQNLAWWRSLSRRKDEFRVTPGGKRVRSDSGQRDSRGPMSHAFITANPLADTNVLKRRGVDKFVAKLNENVEHSLLRCKGKYSVQVASFSGRVIIDQSKIQQISAGRLDPDDQLGQAALKAHQVCEALRAKGYEAYEFHDRTASIVTVGSFETIGAPRSDGRIEIDPAVHRVMKVFSADQHNVSPTLTSTAKRPVIGKRPKTINGVPLDLQPLPIEVPRRSFGADYSRK